MIIDTHTHLNLNAFKEDSLKIIEKCLENNIWMVNIGTQYETSKKAIQIAENYKEGVYASVGLHPINLETGLVKIKTDPEEGGSREEFFDYEKYKELASKNKVVAIGEIGLDYYWKPKTTKKKNLFKEKQKELLSQQLKLAKELKLPVIFHCRMAHEDMINLLKEKEDLKPQKAVAHGFVGTEKELKEYLDLGFYVGINGIIFKKIEGIDFEKNIKEIPLEKIVFETDAPYLTPPPFQGKRNEPSFLKYIIQKTAEIKNISFEEMSKISFENATKLFNIPKQ
jgi:TatD DNase family protein